MRKKFFILLCLLSCTAMVSCRSSREVKASERRTQLAEIDVVARRVDSLWSHLVERYHVHIEFYEPNEVPPQINDTSTKATLQGAASCLANHPIDSSPLTSQRGNDMGWFGAVKSIDIEAERTQSEQSLSQADSTAVSKTETKATLQEDKTTVARQDNGTWAIVSVVAAVAFIVALIIVLKKFLKK